MDQTSLSLLSQTVKGTEVATVIEILFLLTILSLGPVLLITLTSFTRIVIVLSFLRQAMGTHQSPSNQIIIALSLFLSIYVMTPVWEQIEAGAVMPYLRAEIEIQEAVTQAWNPLSAFLLKHTRKSDLDIFMEMRGTEEVTATILIPAFIISELKTAFQIAFLIYMPFVVLDLVISSVLLSMGMMFLPPVLVSLPFKLVLFVLVDGWNLLVGSLVRSFE